MFTIIYSSILFMILNSFQVIASNINNIDTKFPIIFSFQKSNSGSLLNDSVGSHFGYSLAAIQNNGLNNVMIGAPKHQSIHNRNIQRSGAVFHCQLSDNIQANNVICKEVDPRIDGFEPKKNMHLGSSLTTYGNQFISCAHLWVFGYNPSVEVTPIGQCLEINERGDKVLKNFGITPRTGSIEDPGRHLMLGFSSAYSKVDQNIFIIGGPGYHGFSGSVYEFSQRVDMIEINQPSRGNTYRGYSLTTGLFDGNAREYLVAGAPRENLKNKNDPFLWDKNSGKVYISRMSSARRGRFQVLSLESDSTLNDEYFGASVVALDINGDKYDDLVVGAPLYSETDLEVGRIYVFMNNKNDRFERQIKIAGQVTRGRFGTTLSSIDLNLDDYQDLVVSSPFEDNPDGSQGAVYIYSGPTIESYIKPKRLSAQGMANPVLRGFGISLLTNTDFDGNGYNDLLIGSYLTENAVLLRSRPIANLAVNRIAFEPSKIIIGTKNSISVKYCVQYNGKHIRETQLASIVLNITDSKIRFRERRVLVNNKRSDEKTIQLKANVDNCFAGKDSFVLQLSDTIHDLFTPIEVQFTIKLKDETNDQQFCKDCPIADSNSQLSLIDFEHGCPKKICSSRLKLRAITKYLGQPIKESVIEGQSNTIDVDISIVNELEAAINTILIIRMNPVLLKLTRSGDTDRCVRMDNSSSYECFIHKVFQSNTIERRSLHFDLTGVSANKLDIEFIVKTDSQVETRSKTNENISFKIIKSANITLKSEKSNDFSFSDKTPRVTFTAGYVIQKTGPSSVDNAYLEFMLPSKIIETDGVSSRLCRIVSKGYSKLFPIVNRTMQLDCEDSEGYCTEYRCQLSPFKSGQNRRSYYLNLALIPSIINRENYDKISFKLKSVVKTDNKMQFESEIKSLSSMTLMMMRDIPIIDAKVEPWVLFVSSGFGIFFLILTVICLIKIGFFRRKKREELEKVKQRMSMKPDSHDLKIIEEDEDEVDHNNNSHGDTNDQK